MSGREEIQQAVHRFYEARAKSDLQTTLGMVHPECVFRIVGSDKLGPMTQTCDTPDVIRTAASALFAAWDLSGLKSLTFNVDANIAFVHRKGTVRFLPTGQEFETEFMDKLTVKDGLVIEYLQFVDTYEIAKVAGLN